MMKPMVLRTIPNSYIWVLDEDYPFNIRGVSVYIPKGFKTDLASVPRVFQNIFPSDGKYKECAVIHDYLLEQGYYPRKYCDRLFYWCMVDNGIHLVTARVLYTAVRLYTRAKRRGLL